MCSSTCFPFVYRILSSNNIGILAIKISDLFPNETSETYYVPPTKLLYGGGTKVSIARGKLVDKYRNQLRDLRNCGLFKKRKNQSEVKIICNVDCNDSYVWLKNNRKPFTDVIEHWNKTYIKREQSPVANVAQFVKDWPILSLPNAYILVETNFYNFFLACKMLNYVLNLF